MAKTKKYISPAAATDETGILIPAITRLRRRVGRLGYRPDLPDLRDWLAERVFPRGMPLPAEVDQSAADSPVEHQGGLGSCTAQAGIGALEFLDRKADGAHTDLSALALYYWTREARGDESEDSGATLRETCKQLAKGVCPLSAWPYEPARFAESPGPEAEGMRSAHRAAAYYRIGPVNRAYHIKAALASGYAVLGGMMLCESAFTDAVSADGRIPMPRLTDLPAGGHAVLLRGYSDRTDTYRFRNSWGPEWGDRGYGIIPQAYVHNPLLFADVWAVRK